MALALKSALITSLSSSNSKLERWLLYLQQFQYKLTHIRGKDNAADVLSRLPVGTTHDHETQATEEFAYSVVSEAVPATLVPKEVEITSEKDPTQRCYVRL